MSSKVGLIISMIFVAMFFLLGADLICVQYKYSDLDAKSVSIGYFISNSGRTDSEFINYLNTKYNVNIKDISDRDYYFGDVIEYTVSTTYKPFIISNSEMCLIIKRSTVLGYYS